MLVERTLVELELARIGIDRQSNTQVTMFRLKSIFNLIGPVNPKVYFLNIHGTGFGLNSYKFGCVRKLIGFLYF
jgi:hypothetical protein